MVAKSRILDILGERALLLPEQVNRGLTANDRVKYLFTLLQGAKQHADDPAAPFSPLRSERQAAGVEEERLDTVVAESRRDATGDYLVPGAAWLHEEIERGIDDMLAPLLAGGDAAEETERFESLRSACAPDGDRVPAAYFSSLTHAQRGRGDSLHLLVMDLHKRLIALQGSLARESIDGARVYRLGDEDRERVRAFMRGLNATAPLRFDHPGLGTTATRSGDSLLIQNDIGATDAHVLVLRVRGRDAVLTYTDIHPRRARFFMSLFEGVHWEEASSKEATGLEESEGYLLCTGRLEAADEDELLRHLEHLGSRIVFLIDWNKARKRLRQLVRQRDAIDLLKWAADHDCGHRAFLELGGERLVYETLEAAGTPPVHYGERLDRVLGRDTVVDHLRFALRTAAEGLLSKRSIRLIRDEIKADLLERLHTAEQGFFALLADHAALACEIAAAVGEGLAEAPCAGSEERLRLLAERAKYWETRADELVVRMREGVHHASDGPWFARLAHDVDDVADQLEDAAFLMPVLPAVETPPGLYAPLAELAAIVLQGTRALVRCLEIAPHLQRGGAREDLHDFLEAVDHIITAEHETDAAERQVTLTLVSAGADARQLHLLSLLARRLEEASDAAARCALILRDRVMGGVMQR